MSEVVVATSLTVISATPVSAAATTPLVADAVVRVSPLRSTLTLQHTQVLADHGVTEAETTYDVVTKPPQPRGRLAQR